MIIYLFIYLFKFYLKDRVVSFKPNGLLFKRALPYTQEQIHNTEKRKHNKSYIKHIDTIAHKWVKSNGVNINNQVKRNITKT